MNETTAKRRILLADDDPFIIELYSNKLCKEGFDVVSAADGEEAVLKLDSLAPDLMILDLNMPRMDGLEVLRYVRYSYSDPNMPVVVLSNAVTDEMMEKVWEMKPTRFLTKRESKPNNVLAELAAVFAEIGESADSKRPLAGSAGGHAQRIDMPALEDALAQAESLNACQGPEDGKRALLAVYKLVHPWIERLRKGDPRSNIVRFACDLEGLFDELYSEPERLSDQICALLKNAVGKLALLERAAERGRAESARLCRVLLSIEDRQQLESCGGWFDKPGFHPVKCRDNSVGRELLLDNRFDLAVFGPVREPGVEKIRKTLLAGDALRPGLLLFLAERGRVDRISESLRADSGDCIPYPPLKSELLLRLELSLLKDQ